MYNKYFVKKIDIYWKKKLNKKITIQYFPIK